MYYAFFAHSESKLLSPLTYRLSLGTFNLYKFIIHREKCFEDWYTFGCDNVQIWCLHVIMFTDMSCRFESICKSNRWPSNCSNKHCTNMQHQILALELLLTAGFFFYFFRIGTLIHF